MAGARRSRFERIQGIVFDIVLVGVAALVAEDFVQQWLFEHPAGLYYGLAALHLVAFPFMIFAIIDGWGRAGRSEEVQRKGAGALGWAVALYFAGGFVAPGVLTLSLDTQLWLVLTTVFGPIALLAAVVGLALLGERQGWWPPRRMDDRPGALGVQSLALVCWAYLVWVETMMLVAAAKGGPIGGVGVAFGVFINYLPLRVLLFYVRDSYGWERWTIAASTVHLMLRIAMVQA